MNSIYRSALSLLILLPLLVTAPVYAQAGVADDGKGTVTLTAASGKTFTFAGKVNADGSVTVTPAGQAPITLPAAIAGQLASALSASSATAIGEAIAEIVSANSALFTANTGLLAALATVSSMARPDSGNAVALGVLAGASEIGVLHNNPDIATQIVAGVTSTGASVSQQTQSTVKVLVAAAGNDDDRGQNNQDDQNDQDGQENPATTDSEVEPGEVLSPIT